MSKIKGFLVLFAVGFFVYLYIQARKGDVASIAILAVWAALFLVLMGVGIAILVQYATGRRDSLRFQENMKENLALMGAMQRVQNQQNAMLLKENRDTRRLLPSAGDTVDMNAIEYDDAIFSVLDEE